MTAASSGFNIDHAASLLIRTHGRDAGTEARRKADQRMLGGDAYGMLAWHLVAKVIEDRADGARHQRYIIPIDPEDIGSAVRFFASSKLGKGQS